MSRAKVVQICQNELFLFIFQVLSIPSQTELLHHTHFIWLHLVKTGLFESFNGSAATSQLVPNKEEMGCCSKYYLSSRYEFEPGFSFYRLASCLLCSMFSYLALFLARFLVYS